MKNKFNLDKTDIKILEIIQNNARISNVDIASMVEISPSPCLRRIRHLEEQGFIKGYFAELNPALLEMESTVFTSIHAEFEKDTERQTFEEALKSLEQVREVFVLATGNDYLCKIYTKDYQSYKTFVMNYLAKLPYVKQIKSTHVNSVIKNKYGVPIIINDD